MIWLYLDSYEALLFTYEQQVTAKADTMVQSVCQIWKMDFPNISLINTPFSLTYFIIEMSSNKRKTIGTEYLPNTH